MDCNVIRILQHEHLDESDLKYTSILKIEGTAGSRLDLVGSQILEKLGPMISGFQKIIVQGDTATTFYATLCAFQNRIQVVHLEAGLRTYDLENPYPEEGYRQMISRIATIHLVPHEHNKTILQEEKVSGEIFVVGNTILDLVKSYNLTVSQGNTILITFHRRENIQYLSDFIHNLKECIYANPSKRFLWFLHPNPELQRLVREKTEGMSIEFVMPIAHRGFLDYLKDCFCVFTDSGGIQEEAAFLGKPTIVLRKFTERDQIPPPYLQLVSPPYNTLAAAACRIDSDKLPPCYVYGTGESAHSISSYLT
jgi:UDP-N-acetylglucosamine 2-epimerase (non-hydrolysing)